MLLRKFAGHSKSVLFLTRTVDHSYVWSGDSRAVVRIYDTHVITNLSAHYIVILLICHSPQSLRQIKEIDTGAKSIYTLRDIGGNVFYYL